MKDQFASTIKISDFEIGGFPGENPPVLIGSIFYMRHKLVQDAEKGIFDQEKTLKLIKNITDLADKTGVSFMYDVVGNTSKALVSYIKFLKDNSKFPMLLNATLPEVRIGAVQELAKLDLLDDVVYNSINPFSTDEEVAILKEMPIDKAIIQAYNPGSKKEDGALKALLGTRRLPSLLERALECGIDKVMIDVPTYDMYSIGTVIAGADLIRKELDVPVGTSASNATYSSEWIRNKDNLTTEQFHIVDAAVNGMMVSQNCDFLLFGPVEGYKWVFPACAATSAIHAFNLRKNNIQFMDKRHPANRVL
ncbi:MAG: hypothetical protein GX127_01950 [Eubacteriaceae bacterium]|jgi:tetrahydromethanopterin S-methyltransferase subunit H|nr:hypothetical protein [Eubacteriaceae bacterium]